MYTPAAFQVTNVDQLHQFMRLHSFAALVSSAAEGVEISHLPLHLDPSAGPLGTLRGHVAKANPHAGITAEACTAAIFQGPHAYISPTWYEEPNLVPTWNYIAVHARGRLRWFADRDRLWGLLREMTADYEGDRPVPWSLDQQDAEVMDRLLGGIVGFELPIESLEGKWKLSQNHPVARRERVIAALRASGTADEVAVSQLMAAALPPH